MCIHRYMHTYLHVRIHTLVLIPSMATSFRSIVAVYTSPAHTHTYE